MSKLCTTPRCPCTDSPFANLSSEKVDHPIYVGMDWAIVIPPLGADWSSASGYDDYLSEVSQQDANTGAHYEAVTGVPYTCLGRCCTCRPPSSGCECVPGCGSPCTTQPPVPPINPQPPVPPSPGRTFRNAPLLVEEECPSGGGTYLYLVPGGLFSGFTQFDADMQAFQAGGDLALAHMICLDDLIPDMCVDDAIYTVVTATGGTPDSWLITAGSIPTGLSFSISADKRSMVLVGTPSEGGIFTFTIRCTDPDGNYVERDYIKQVVEITTADPLPDGTGAVPYSVTLEQEGGVGAVTWALNLGSLPTGLTLHSDTGVIDGTPTAGGTSDFTISMTDANGFTCYKDFSLTVIYTLTFTFRGGCSICGGGSFTTQIIGITSPTAGGAPDCFSFYMNPIQAGLTANVGVSYTVEIISPNVTDGYKFEVSAYDPSFQPYIDGVAANQKSAPGQPAGYHQQFTLQFQHI